MNNIYIYIYIYIYILYTLGILGHFLGQKLFSSRWGEGQASLALFEN